MTAEELDSRASVYFESMCVCARRHCRRVRGGDGAARVRSGLGSTERPEYDANLLARVLMARTITLNIAMTTRPTNEEASDERGGRAVHADDDSGDYAALRVEPCRDVSALLVLKERASCAARATSRAAMCAASMARATTNRAVARAHRSRGR